MSDQLVAFFRSCDIESVVALRDLLHLVHVAGEYAGLTDLVGEPSIGEPESLDEVIGRVGICPIPQEARTAWDQARLGQLHKSSGNRRTIRKANGQTLPHGSLMDQGTCDAL